MSLKDKIESNYNNSIKEKDSNSINTLRLIKSAIKDKEISLRGKQDALTDSDVLSLLQSSAYTSPLPKRMFNNREPSAVIPI